MSSRPTLKGRLGEGFIESADSANQALNCQLMHLSNTGMELVDEHWKWVLSMEKRASDWKNKSRLQIRCRQYESGAFSLEWTEVVWVSLGDKKRVRKLEYIPMLKDSHGYSKAKLQRLARDWEVEAVLKLEEKLAAIRKAASYLHKAKANLGYANTAFLALERMEVQENG